MNKKVIDSYLDRALSNPYHAVSFVEDGFGFHLYWMPIHNHFECTMMFNPEWGHTNSIYGRTKDEFIKFFEEKIKEEKKLYTNGGKFPKDYYKYCD